MKHYQAMEAIKSLIPEKEHHELNAQNSKVKTLQEGAYSRPRPLPPAFTQAQAETMMGSNLDKTVNKEYPLRKMPSQEATRSFNPSQWGVPTGAKARPVATEPVNITASANNAPGTTRYRHLIFKFLLFLYS